jgi:hypothetical protein
MPHPLLDSEATGSAALVPGAPFARAPGGPGEGAPSRRAGLAVRAGFVVLSGVSAAAVLTGRPVIAAAALVLALLWAVRDVVLTWTGGVAFLLLVLQFVPSRAYRLPFGAAFDIDPYRLCLLLLLAVWLVASVAQGRFRIQATRLDVGIALFLTAAVLSFAMNAALFVSSSDSATMIKSMAYLVSFPITYYLIATTIRSSRHAVALVDVSVLFAGVAGVMAVVERITQYNVFLHLSSFIPLLEYLTPGKVLSGDVRGGGIRVEGPTAHPIAFATMLAMLLPLCVARALHAESKLVRVVSAVCALCICVGIFLSVSRTGVVGLIAGGVILFVGFPRERGILAAASAVVVGFVFETFPGAIDSLVQYFTPSFVLSQEVGNQYGRLVDYGRSLPYLLNRPVFGRGFNSFSPDRFGFIDNQYLKFGLEIGAFGVAAFLYLMWRAVSVPFRRGRQLGGEIGAVLLGCAAAAAVFAVTSATFDTVGFPQVAYLFFAIAGLGAVIERESRAEARSG